MAVIPGQKSTSYARHSRFDALPASSELKNAGSLLERLWIPLDGCWIPLGNRWMMLADLWILLADLWMPLDTAGYCWMISGSLLETAGWM